MKLKYILFLILFSSFVVNATNVRVINIDFVINQNLDFKKFIEDIETDQKIYRSNFKNLELEFQKKNRGNKWFKINFRWNRTR